MWIITPVNHSSSKHLIYFFVSQSIIIYYSLFQKKKLFVKYITVALHILLQSLVELKLAQSKRKTWLTRVSLPTTSLKPSLHEQSATSRREAIKGRESKLSAVNVSMNYGCIQPRSTSKFSLVNVLVYYSTLFHVTASGCYGF